MVFLTETCWLIVRPLIDFTDEYGVEELHNYMNLFGYTTTKCQLSTNIFLLLYHMYISSWSAIFKH